jgi:hypothetical protein
VNYQANHDILLPYYDFMVSTSARLFNRGNSIHLDLANDIYTSLCQRDTDQLKQIHKDGKMEAYIFKAIYSERRDSKSKFAKMYKRETPTFEIVETSREAPINMAALGRLTDFEAQVLAVYMRYGTVTEAAKKTRIQKQTYFNYINRIFTKLCG